MKRKILCNIVVMLLLSGAVFANNDSVKVAAKPSVYQGMTLKLDIVTPALTAGLSKGKLQQYEVAMNWRLKDRFYPTLELGYAGGKTQKGDTLKYNAHGGYFRVGCDINPLKKHPDSPHAMLIAILVTGTIVTSS